MTMRDEKGKAGVMLAVGKGGVTLDLCDEKGKVIGSAP